ncbi:hypothetical protein DRO30_03310 [Candidatus Bathyarchaeota archaeon]|nr:MAG: hypothetical protein DRO30_03310 [Candidatus Bathyarchaeota archaeon]
MALFRRKSIKPKSTLEIEYQLVFKPGMLDDIKRVKGWKTDTQMAKELNFTRGYVSQWRHGGAVSADAILAIAKHTGTINGAWWAPFEIVPKGIYKPNHPVFNTQKLNGKRPYEAFSLQGDFRKAEKKDWREKVLSKSSFKKRIWLKFLIKFFKVVDLMV